MTVVIGLTGGIASGKSTVSRMFTNLEIPVIDADVISREVVRPGEKAYKQIVTVFGAAILNADETIDRKKLGQLVFTDEQKRQQLNDIVHPAVREEMIEQRDQYTEKKVKAVVLDIPLLFESRLTHFVEKVMVVYVDEQTQLNRLMARDNFKEEEALSRINAQLPVRKKAEMADAVIDNTGTVSATEQQLKRVLKQWNILKQE